MYNYSKYKILAAIYELTNEDKKAISPAIALATGLSKNNTSRLLSKYYSADYINRSVYEVHGHFRGFHYRLKKKGLSVLDKFSIRYLNGNDLNLRKKPRPCDFKDGGILLPGYKGGI